MILQDQNVLWSFVLMICYIIIDLYKGLEPYEIEIECLKLTYIYVIEVKVK